MWVIESARTVPTRFQYDERGNLTNVLYVNDSAEAFTYYPNGAVHVIKNRRGETVELTGNGLGQIERKRYSVSGRIVDYFYDLRGFLTNATDSLLGTNSLYYDARGYLTNITYHDGKGFTFINDDAGARLKRISHDDGYTLIYDYDSVGRLEYLRDGLSNSIVRYHYYDDGLLRREDKGNGTWTSYGYDASGQLRFMTNRAPDGTIQSWYEYNYDNLGRRTNVSSSAGTASYGYDQLNQLTNVTYPDRRSVSYEYDASGNRLAHVENGLRTQYVPDDLNQYISAGSKTYYYDADGNVERVEHPGGTIRYSYDEEHRLIRIEKGSFFWTFTYDAFGNRVAAMDQGGTKLYLYDPTAIGDLALEYDREGRRVCRYNHALGLVARDAGELEFFSFDGIGNTCELTSFDGSVAQTFTYDIFGKMRSQNPEGYNAFAFIGKFGLLSEPNDLIFARARYYDPETGRFTSIDPVQLRDGPNDYTYARNDPIGLVDFTGQRAAAAVAYPHPPPYLFGRRPPDPKSSRGEIRRAPGGGRKTKKSEEMLETLLQYQRRAELVQLGYYWPLQGPVIDIQPHVTVPTIDWPGEAPTVPLQSTNVSVVTPRDPNDKIGPLGAGLRRVVASGTRMQYIIRFENLASATAPVQELTVVDYLHSGLEWATVMIEEVAYGGRTIALPTSNSASLRDTPPPTSSAITGTGASKMVVDISLNFNPQNGRIEWRLSAVDTNTGSFPEDALTGFLPPENGTGRGQGYVRFSVTAKADLALGTIITNIATIVFDGNEPISTPPVWNTIGDIPAISSAIAYLPGEILAGIPFTYTITLTNSGTSAVTNIWAANSIPGAEIAIVSATGGEAQIVNGEIIWNVGTLAGSSSSTITVTARPRSSGSLENLLFYSGGSGLAVFSAPSTITVLPPSRPELRISRDGNFLELSWASTGSTFNLERSDSLGADATWTAVQATPLLVDQSVVVRVEPPRSTQFFRLRSP